MTMIPQHTNWAGNYTYQAARLHTPHTLEEVQELVRRTPHIKALGTRHSFNGLADTRHDHLSLQHLTTITIDAANSTVTVGAGVLYGELGAALTEAGFALPNMASLPHISVVGACATATHGSGDACGNLATAVCAMEIVTAEGDLRTLVRGDADFAGAVVGLGGVGIVTALTLDLLPFYQMRQDVYLDLPVTALELHFEAIFSAAYSVSLFTTWQDTAVEKVWLKSRVDDAPIWEQDALYGAAKATQPIAPIIEVPVERCTEQGRAGAWNERLPHFRMAFTPSFGEELQSEYFVPRSQALAAFARVRAMRDVIAPHLLISEIRTVAADALWMSPQYGRDSVGIHFTWKQHPDAVHALLPQIEAQLAPLGMRPHWGKLFTVSAAHLAAQYEKRPAFQELLRRYDPAGKFRNDFLAATIFGD